MGSSKSARGSDTRNAECVHVFKFTGVELGNVENQRWRGVKSRDGFTQCRGFVHIRG